MESIIKINCEGSDVLPLNEIKPFQGDIKTLSDKNRERLKTVIIKYGFTCPFFIWEHEGQNYLLDGHQRLNVLNWMQNDGWKIPKLPVVYIHADTEKKAKQLLLHITSQYGEFNKQNIKEIIDKFNINTNYIMLRNSPIKLKPLKLLSLS